MNRMKSISTVLVGLALLLAPAASGHPGSGIAVGANGRVYFVDTGGGLFVIVRPGVVERLEGPALHWFAFDPESRFRSTRWPAIPNGELHSAGVNPTVVLSSDVPVAIGPDALYLPEKVGSDRVRIVNIAPSGATSVRALLPPVQSGGRVATWINGLAAGPNNFVYYTEDRAVRKIDPAGRVSTVAEVAPVAGCQAIPGIGAEARPNLRGLAVAPDGTVYVAASGCGAVLKITPRGTVTKVLQATSPWSPTGVAVSGGDVFVLEYLHTASSNRREWLPRVRRLARDGTVVTLANTTAR